MRRTKTKTRTSPRPTPRRRSAEPYLALSKQAEELMELAVEAAQSRHLPDFLEQFALRSTRMLDAVWGGGGVFGGGWGEKKKGGGNSPAPAKRKGGGGKKKSGWAGAGVLPRLLGW